MTVLSLVRFSSLLFPSVLVVQEDSWFSPRHTGNQMYVQQNNAFFFNSVDVAVCVVTLLLCWFRLGWLVVVDHSWINNWAFWPWPWLPTYDLAGWCWRRNDVIVGPRRKGRKEGKSSAF